MVHVYYSPTYVGSGYAFDTTRKAQWIAKVLSSVLGDRAYFADELSVADIQLYAATAKSLEGGVFDAPPANLQPGSAASDKAAADEQKKIDDLFKK